MTKYSKIDRNAAQQPRMASSLIERADEAFGLRNLDPVAVPGDLPREKAAGFLAMAEPPAAPDAAVALRSESKVKLPEAPIVSLSGPPVEVDRELLEEAGLITPDKFPTGLLEEFRIVKRELLADARMVGTPAARRILVCSPHKGEGKTYTSINLAIALAAESGIEVVLIDADVLNPSIGLRLGLKQAAGLMDALADPNVPPEEMVSPTDIDGLFVMQAGTTTGFRDAEILASARTAEVLERLTYGAPDRIFIFDTPPALAASPAAELAAHVGQTLLVVRANVTSRAALEDARQLLSACPDIKLLLNAVQFSPSGRRFGEYGHGER